VGKIPQLTILRPRLKQLQKFVPKHAIGTTNCAILPLKRKLLQLGFTDILELGLRNPLKVTIKLLDNIDLRDLYDHHAMV